MGGEGAEGGDGCSGRTATPLFMEMGGYADEKTGRIPTQIGKVAQAKAVREGSSPSFSLSEFF